MLSTTPTSDEARFRLLVENIGDVFCFKEIDPLRFFYVSTAFERIWGFGMDELHRKAAQWDECIHPEDRKAVRGALLSTPMEKSRIAGLSIGSSPACCPEIRPTIGEPHCPCLALASQASPLLCGSFSACEWQTSPLRQCRSRSIRSELA